MDWITTSTILGRLRDWRDEGAWETFDRRFRTPVTRFVRGMGLTEEMAEDAAQETMITFARLYREGRYEPGRGKLSSWLFGIAYKTALKIRTRAAAPRENPIGGTEGARRIENMPDEKTATTIWEYEWRRFVLGQCLERVRHEFEPDTMRVFEKLMDHASASEVADELGVPVKMVYNAKHRVLNRMRAVREELEEIREE